MTRAVRFAGVTLALVLAACGARRDLQPAPGTTLPVAPIGARATPTAPDLTRPTTVQRPSRSDELLTDSVERTDDPFNLPPER